MSRTWVDSATIATGQLSAGRCQRLVGLLFIDMDNFKQVNDTLGHGVGDLLLKAFAGILTESVRKSDTVARQGGDEFIIMLTDIKSPDDAALVMLQAAGGFSYEELARIERASVAAIEHASAA